MTNPIKKNVRIKTFKKAGVYMSRGMLVVNATECSMEDKHYDVEVIESETGVTVTADRPEYACNIDVFRSGSKDLDPNNFVESSVKEYKPWPWSRKKERKVREGWAEYKKRIAKKYTANNYTIIEPYTSHNKS